MIKGLAAVVCALAIGLAAPASAQRVEEDRPPGELAREGVERLMRALELFIEMIPQYEMPELNENGDIIIRRKRPRDDDPVPEPEVDKTRT